MKDYTITLTEKDIRRIMRALLSREAFFRIQDNGYVADEYKRLFEMFKALYPTRPKSPPGDRGKPERRV